MLALLSVSDKRGLVEFAERLVRRGVRLLSTGGTAEVLRSAGLNVRDVADYTGSPEVMEGRVKTLHPRVHGGILARDLASDRADLASLGGEPIDLVVVNLYPFQQTVARGATRDEAIEQIDIGGPAMIRAAAKNHGRVAVVVDPGDYARVADAVEKGALPAALRAELAAKAFAHTAQYDGVIASYLGGSSTASMPGGESAGAPNELPARLIIDLPRVGSLRYGENPHQHAALYAEHDAKGFIASASDLGQGGRGLSFNNLKDAHAAWELVSEFSQTACAIIKHMNPCGVALGSSVAEALERAWQGDPLSAFGGIVAFNAQVDSAVAAALADRFIECIVAPSFAPDALEALRRKKNLRILALEHSVVRTVKGLDIASIGGGLLVQTPDVWEAAPLADARCVTKVKPTAAQLLDLELAWRICKHVKSNAIVLVKDGAAVGVGAGQMSRVDSVRGALAKAGERAAGSVLASDAFFPFADGIELAIAGGVVAVVHPGGSVRDDEVIAAADTAKVPMVFTGKRHFRH